MVVRWKEFFRSLEVFPVAELLLLFGQQQRRGGRRSGLKLRRWVKENGSNQADCSEVNGWESAPQAAGHKSSQEKRPLYRRDEETSSLQARDCCASRNPSSPEIHRASDPETAFPEAGEGDRPGFQNRLEVPECRHRRAAGELAGAVCGRAEGRAGARPPRRESNSVALVLHRRLAKRIWWVCLKILICVPSTLRE